MVRRSAGRDSGGYIDEDAGRRTLDHENGAQLVLLPGHTFRESGRMSAEFWVTTIVLTATPGTGALFAIAAGLAGGARAGVVAAFGCTLGIVPHLALALTGAAAVLAASAVAFEAVKWAGVAYLVYMAWGAWRHTGVLAPGDSTARSGRASTEWKVIGTAVLVNLLNPKLTVFFFVFLPMFVDPSADGAVLQMTALGAAIMAITMLIFSIYAVGAAWLRRHVVGRPTVMRWVGRVFALSFVVLALMLALTRH